MIHTTDFYPSADGIHQIFTQAWHPAGQPRGILQIVHGICEYSGRYDRFARFLADQGFLVVAEDHLGHGKSAPHEKDRGYFARKQGWKTVVDDVAELHRRTAAQHPGVPYFLLGHSMGSFLTRTYLFRKPAPLAGVILSGTGQQPGWKMLGGRAITRLYCLLAGEHFRSGFVHGMALGSYNKPFIPNRTDKDWLTRDEAVVDAYMQDPLSMFRPTVSLYHDMMQGIARMQKPANLQKMQKNLPILFVSGDQDPVGDMGEGVKAAYDSFLQAGCTDITLKLYAGARHELLNELNRAEVYEDLKDWLVGKLD